jgi:Flp pilus assembly protein TadD
VLDSYGVFLSSNGRLKEAESSFNEALQLNNKDELAHVNLGNLFRQQGKLAASEREYQTAISLDGENAITHYNLALLYTDEGKLDKALAELARALKLDSTDSDIRAEIKIVEKLKEQSTQEK